MSVAERAQKLRSLVQLLADSAEVAIKEWESAGDQPTALSGGDTSGAVLPSPALFEARRIFMGACGMGMDLIQDPAQRLTAVSGSFFDSRALLIAAEARLADVLGATDPAEGMSIGEISEQVGIPKQHLTRVLRCLCSIHIFDEVKEDHYANNTTSRALVNNEGLRCWLLVHNNEVYTAADKLPTVLFHAKENSPWQEAYGTTSDFWHWLDEQIPGPDGTLVPRPERAIWKTGMWEYGLEKVQAIGVNFDYPWASLGSRTIVDVGAGTRGISLALAKMFPDLHFVVQDRPFITQVAEEVWKSELPDALTSGRVRFMAHNFFEEQPVQRADVYVMRHILHDWADEECVKILTHLRKAMGPNSVLLNMDNVMQSTAGSRFLKAAPAPLPPNYGCAHSHSNHHDLYMYAMFNGGERTVEQFAALAARAGLRIVKVWECRSLTSITEMRIPE